MSDDDLNRAPFNEWFDSEADFPDISSVNTTPYMGVNVSSLSAYTHYDRAQENEDSSAIDSAPKRVNPADNVPFEEEGPHKEDDLLDSSIHTPLKASPCHLFRVTVVGPWVEEEGRDKTLGKSL